MTRPPVSLTAASSISRLALVTRSAVVGALLLTLFVLPAEAKGNGRTRSEKMPLGPQTAEQLLALHNAERAEAVVRAWMRDNHRKTILNNQYHAVGFGYARGPAGGIVWVADFGASAPHKPLHHRGADQRKDKKANKKKPRRSRSKDATGMKWGDEMVSDRLCYNPLLNSHHATQPDESIGPYEPETKVDEL